MITLYRPANQNKEYENKAEYLRLAAIVWPHVKHFRWDKSKRSLDNFLWFLKFEASFSERAAELRREELWNSNAKTMYSERSKNAQ